MRHFLKLKISLLKSPFKSKNITASSSSLFSTFFDQVEKTDLNQLAQENNIIDVNNSVYWTKHIHKLCAVDRNPDAALQLVHRLSLHGYHLNALNVNSIVHGLCHANRFSQAHHQVLLYIDSQPNLLDERTCNVIIARLLDGRMPHSTLRVIEGLINANPNFVPSLNNYNRLIHQLGELMKPSEAHQVFLDAKRRGHFINVVSYTSLINGYCKVGEMEVANKLFDEMCECGLKPNTLTHSVLVRGTFRKRDLEKGKLLMERLWKVMEGEKDQDLNNAAFGNVINCLCQEGFFSEVFKIAEDMPQGKNVLEEFAYGQMIESLCRFGRYNGAARIVYMMRKRGFNPGCQSYNSILHRLCQEGDCFRAYQLLEEGISFGYVPSEFTFKILVEVLCHENDLVKAKEVLNIMLKNKMGKDKTRIYNIYLRALCFTNSSTELLNTLVAMLQTQCQPDIITLNTVLNGFCRMGRIEEASKVLKDMMAGSFCAPDAVSFTTLISGFLGVGNIEEALDLFKNVMPVYGFKPNVVTYNVILRGFFNLGQPEKAMEIFHIMVAEGVTADCTTYSAIIKGLCDSKKIDEAKRFWDDIIWPSQVHDAFIYSAILQGLCRADKFSEACDFLYELADCGVTLNNVNYNIVIDAACKLGMKKEAYQILGEMKKNGLTPDSVTWRILNRLHGNANKHYGEEYLADSERVH
ncbi:hypothetical protein M9H77_29060 [Catharanthus roseus]|uniref:Uncharacterized protein n=1 Tax=Catharanthus roseus TaxID=4058 RepID=A0ACC0AH34_CATRO|nr:hypothetical protein M9H77_29060 [Catharanthus roseus]